MNATYRPQDRLEPMPATPVHKKTSVSSPDPRSNVGSQGYGPEFEPTAAGQGLTLLTHIIRAFGISFALVINGIVFIPFFLFGILPLLIKERLRKSSVQPNAVNQRRNKIQNADVSPLLLPANASTSDLVLFADRSTVFTDIGKDFLPLPGPVIEASSGLNGSSIHCGSTVHVTHPGIPATDPTRGGDSDCYFRPNSSVEYTSETRNLALVDEHPVETLEGISVIGEGVTSGHKVLGHNHFHRSNTTVKRGKST